MLEQYVLQYIFQLTYHLQEIRSSQAWWSRCHDHIEKLALVPCYHQQWATAYDHNPTGFSICKSLNLSSKAPIDMS